MTTTTSTRIPGCHFAVLDKLLGREVAQRDTVSAAMRLCVRERLRARLWAEDQSRFVVEWRIGQPEAQEA